MKEQHCVSMKQLYKFLTACGGNWRKTIHISAQEGCTGWLLAADRDGAPVLLRVDALERGIQERIDTSECRGTLTESAFTDIFTQYLYWQLPATGITPADTLNLLSDHS